MSNKILIFSLFLSLTACTNKANVVTNTPSTTTTQTAVPDEPQILFIQLKIVQKDKNAPVLATVASKKSVNGLLDKPLRGVELLEGHWLISLLDSDQKMVAQEVVQDPINQHFEYQNEKGQLDNKTVVKPETDCFVRVQNNPKFQYLKCESIVEKKVLKPLFQIKL
jgi:hypothetical protein